MHNENVEIVHHMIVDFFQFCHNQRVTFFTDPGAMLFLEIQGASKFLKKLKKCTMKMLKSSTV